MAVTILTVYYSLYGHTLALARAAAAGAAEADGAESVLRRAREFPETEADMANHPHALKVWEEQREIPECSLDDLRRADGLLMGSPTRYGAMIAQMKRLIDSTLSLWLAGEMEGKPAGVFTSTATTHGGQESTLLSMMNPLLHLGMVIVGAPYSIPGMIHAEARGGTPYGASTIAGSGEQSLTPRPEDLAIARAQGRRVAELARKLRG